MSRRQTLGVLSPSQINTRSNAAARVASKEAQPTGGAAQNIKGPRKSLATDKAALALMGGANMNGSSFGAGNLGGNAGGPSSFNQSMGPCSIDPRRSSAYNGGKSNGPKADPRPISDKGFQANCMRSVITYLSTHNYPASVSPKTLASPTAKDFTLIVQFLQQQFDPNLKTFGKIEDDVPIFFKRLNYPFQISKSALFAVGSPHSWPAVLAALTWLVELLNYNERIEGMAAQTGSSTGPGVLEDSDASTKRQFFKYICTSYTWFLAGDDAKCSVVDQDMLSQFSSRERLVVEAHERIKQANDSVVSEVKRLQSEPSPLVAAQQRRAERALDAEKFEQLIENLQGLKSSLQRKIGERQEEVAAKQQALATTNRQNDELRARIAAQPVNKADLSRMVMERSKQKEVLDAVTSNAEELEHKLHQQDVQLVSCLKSLEGGVSRYNQLAHRLKLIPASAKRAAGATYELRINREATAQQDFANVDLKGSVKPGLEHLCEMYRTKAAQLGRDLLGLREAAAGSAESLNEKQEENKAMEAQISKLESQLASLREAREERVREMAGRADQLQDDVSSLRSTAAARAAEVTARKVAVINEFEALKRQCDADLAQLRVELRTALEAMLQHRMHVQHVLGATLEAVKGEQQAMAAVHVPTC